MSFLRHAVMFLLNVIFFTTNAAVVASVFWFWARLNGRNPDFEVYLLNTWWALFVIWLFIKTLEFLTGKEILAR